MATVSIKNLFRINAVKGARYLSYVPKVQNNFDSTINKSIAASSIVSTASTPGPINIKERYNSLVPSFEDIGTVQLDSESLEQPEEFNPTELTMTKMLASGLHLGSSTELWNPKNLPFIFGSRADINIFNLEATMSYLKRACAFTREVAFNNGIILFLSSKPEFASATVKAAQRSNSYYVYHKWVPGAISNRESVLGSKSFVYYEGEQIEYKNYKPDLLIVANYQDNKKAIAEATRYNIPTIAIIDSDQDPAGVTYPIPGNDDSVKGIELVFGLLSTAARDGMAKREYLAKKEVEKESKKADLDSKVKEIKPEEKETYAFDP